MKKVFLPLLLAVILAVAAVPFSGPFPKYAVGESVSQMSYAKREESFVNVVKRAPIIAEVVITRYRGSVEESTRFHCTLYDAKITTCYKNTTGKDLTIIPLLQDGTTEWTLNGYPLFQTGDRLLLAMAPCSDYEGVIADSLSGYYLIDRGNQTAMQIIESEDGDVCRTFMPDMLDLPDKQLTASMKQRAEKSVTEKHRSASAATLAMIPPYTSAAYADLKEMIQKVLA